MNWQCSGMSAAGPIVAVVFFLAQMCAASLWSEIQRISDLSEFARLCTEWPVCQAYLDDPNAKITVFAPVNAVFAYNPRLMVMDQKQLLGHIADQQIGQIQKKGEWDKQTLIRSSVNSGNIYVTQFENNPGNFSYYANNGQICNHVSSSWSVISGEQYLYKVCTPMGYRGFPGSALSLIRMSEENFFVGRNYDNQDLSQLRDMLERVPDVALVIYGSNAWNGFHTFFLPNNDAFAKVDYNKVDREVLLAHVTGTNRVLFAHAWLYDGGIHYYPSVQFTSTVIEDNFKLKLAIRNITDRKTGKYELYAVSEVYERYSLFRRGAVWARIVQPNIPLTNGVAHVVDNVLAIVSQTLDQMLNENHRCTTLMNYMNRIGSLVRSYVSAQGGMVTFFAPINEAFDRIPERVEQRLLRGLTPISAAPSRPWTFRPGRFGWRTLRTWPSRPWTARPRAILAAGTFRPQDRFWLEQVLKLHIVPGKELTSDQISNNTIVNTVDNRRRLFFIKGEWPINNITYYVLGGGVRATILMDNVAGTNGIIHYIDRVLGVPYESMWRILQNQTNTRRTAFYLDNLQLKWTLDPWEVVRPEQNMTFFVPNDEAWLKVAPYLRNKLTDGNHWSAMQYVFKRHIIQGQALQYTDLRERTYIMMNDERVVIRRTGRYFELYWPYGNRVARLVEGGQIGAINGFIHLIDNVLVMDQDLTAGATMSAADSMMTLFAVLISGYRLFWL